MILEIIGGTIGKQLRFCFCLHERRRRAAIRLKAKTGRGFGEHRPG